MTTADDKGERGTFAWISVMTDQTSILIKVKSDSIDENFQKMPEKPNYSTQRVYLSNL